MPRPFRVDYEDHIDEFHAWCKENDFDPDDSGSWDDYVEGLYESRFPYESRGLRQSDFL